MHFEIRESCWWWSLVSLDDVYHCSCFAKVNCNCRADKSHLISLSLHLAASVVMNEDEWQWSTEKLSEHDCHMTCRENKVPHHAKRQDTPFLIELLMAVASALPILVLVSSSMNSSHLWVISVNKKHRSPRPLYNCVCGPSFWPPCKGVNRLPGNRSQ